MDTVAAAALAAIVDHDCARVLQDVVAENDALIQQRDTLRQQRKELKANLRWQAFVNSELHKEVAVLSSSIARLLRRR